MGQNPLTNPRQKTLNLVSERVPEPDGFGNPDSEFEEAAALATRAGQAIATRFRSLALRQPVASLADTFTPATEASNPPQGHDAKCGAACHNLAASKDYIFTPYAKR
jgi:hypothetical protein